MKAALVWIGAFAMAVSEASGQEGSRRNRLDDAFLIARKDVHVALTHRAGQRKLSFAKNRTLEPKAWQGRCRKKLAELIGLTDVSPGRVRELRRRDVDGVTVVALVMRIGNELSIPAYLLVPDRANRPGRAVMAIHGHGEVEPCLGVRDDYHHAFAMVLARAGHLVMCPELRGFGVLKDLAADNRTHILDYWAWGKHKAYSLVTDGFLHGETLIGQTIEDLLRWEGWLAAGRDVKTFDAAGISYGGDLALVYGALSRRAGRVFASGTLGSFSVIFGRCYNAPAHCIPGVLVWMDRSDIAGLNAPRPIAIHYGELDKPGGRNFSASYNETVPRSMAELKAIYKAFGAEDNVRLIVTKGKGHEMDTKALLEFMAPAKQDR